MVGLYFLLESFKREYILFPKKVSTLRLERSSYFEDKSLLILLEKSLRNVLQQVDQIVKDSIKQGAQVLVGGKRLKLETLFYEPTLLLNCAQTRCFNEEIFGPVLALQK